MVALLLPKKKKKKKAGLLRILCSETIEALMERQHDRRELISGSQVIHLERVTLNAGAGAGVSARMPHLAASID